MVGSDCNNNKLRDTTGVKRGDTVGLSAELPYTTPPRSCTSSLRLIREPDRPGTVSDTLTTSGTRPFVPGGDAAAHATCSGAARWVCWPLSPRGTWVAGVVRIEQCPRCSCVT